MDLTRPNEFELISLLIDVKPSKHEEAALLANLSFFERLGVKTLQALAQPMDKATLSRTLARVAHGRNLRASEYLLMCVFMRLTARAILRCRTHIV